MSANKVVAVFNGTTSSSIVSRYREATGKVNSCQRRIPTLFEVIAVEADGLFSDKPMTPFSLEVSKNRPIDADSR